MTPRQPFEKERLRIRALFLSDLHFGYKGTDAAAILDCLQTYAPQTIYLAGDIIDGWKLLKRWYWLPDYTRVIDALVDHKKRGASIVYLPGNHDERVRSANIIERTRYCLETGLRICNSLIHDSADGRRIVVLHGDQFDNFLMRGPVSRLGDRLMEFLTELFDFVRPAPVVMIEGKPKKFSLAKALVKKSGKMALRMLGTLERAAVRLVRRKGADGLICGHTHLPKIRKLRRKYLFGNCGAWTGYSNTAIIETLEGTFELVRWPDMRQPTQNSIPAAHATRMARHRETAITIRRIRQLWPAKRQRRAIRQGRGSATP